MIRKRFHQQGRHGQGLLAPLDAPLALVAVKISSDHKLPLAGQGGLELQVGKFA